MSESRNIIGLLLCIEDIISWCAFNLPFLEDNTEILNIFLIELNKLRKELIVLSVQPLKHI